MTAVDERTYMRFAANTRHWSDVHYFLCIVINCFWANDDDDVWLNYHQLV